MPVQVFGARMQHQIGSQRQRILQRRTQESVIHHAHRPRFTSQRADFRNIHHPQQWITWAFDQYQLRFFRQCRTQRLFIVLIDKQNPIAAALRQAIKQTIAAAVAVVRRHQQIAGLQEYGCHQQNRRHAGIGQNGARSPFQLRQRALYHIAGRITAAGVVVGTRFIKAGEVIGTGKVNRRDNATVLFVVI